MVKNIEEKGVAKKHWLFTVKYYYSDGAYSHVVYFDFYGTAAEAWDKYEKLIDQKIENVSYNYQPAE